MTIDEVFEDLRGRFEAEVRAALEWQASDGGIVEFAVGINRRAKNEIDIAAKVEAMKPENLLARIEALEAGK